MLKADFVLKYSPYAIKAGRKFDFNPKVILATAAYESGYYSSKNAQIGHNFFGITAFGKTNEFWDGSKRTASTGIVFRVYKTDQDCFYDFARLITEKYPTAAKESYNHAKYANLIANSPYINEANGDNRVKYEAGIISILNWIDKNVKIAQNPTTGGWVVTSSILLLTALAAFKIF